MTPSIDESLNAPASDAPFGASSTGRIRSFCYLSGNLTASSPGRCGQGIPPQRRSRQARTLPARLLNAGDQTVRRHLAELDTADAELTNISLRTTRQFATVVLADRIRVAGSGFDRAIHAPRDPFHRSSPWQRSHRVCADSALRVSHASLRVPSLTLLP